MKNNAIIIVLLLFLAVTSFFWFQASRIEDLPPVTNSTPSTINGKDAENFVEIAQRLLIDQFNKEPLPELYGRDPFYRELPVEQVELVELDPSRIFILSSIIYSDLNARAVVNGMILAEGDSLYDEGSGSEFMIESIQVDKVEVINGDKRYTLEKAHEAN